MKIKKILSCAALCALPMSGGFAQDTSDEYFQGDMYSAMTDFNDEYGDVHVYCYYDGKTKVYTNFERNMNKENLQLGETNIYFDEKKIFDQYFVTASGIDAGNELVDYVTTSLHFGKWDCGVSSQSLKGDNCLVSGTGSPRESGQVAYFGVYWNPVTRLFDKGSFNIKIVSKHNIMPGCYHYKYENDDDPAPDEAPTETNSEPDSFEGA